MPHGRAAAIAPVLFPAMKDRGARPGELVALLSATGAQTEMLALVAGTIIVAAVPWISIGFLK